MEVLCDRKMIVKLNGQMHKTMVWAALLYGADTRVSTKSQERRMDVNEMRMLRWMCGVTQTDKPETKMSEDQ